MTYTHRSVSTPLRRTALALMLAGGLTAGEAPATDFGLFAASPGPTLIGPPHTIDTELVALSGDEFITAITMILRSGDTVSSYSVSVRFDADFGNELDIVSVTEANFVTDGSGTLFPVTANVFSEVDSVGVRRRGAQMDTLLSVLAVVNQLGARSREFGTVEVREAAGLSYSQTYGWLHAMRGRGYVTGRLDTSRRAVGDWRWRRRLRLTVADGEA